MSEREQIEYAIKKIEQQRSVLGEKVVEIAVNAMRARIASLLEEDERKLVTIMFADLSGFTAMSEKMDPEEVRRLVNACFERLVKVVEKYEGTVEKFIGDEIMTMFGAPLVHEDDAERAARSALEMMDELNRFNAERGTKLGMHIGINTGLVLAGGIGAGEQQQYGVTGDAVNLAARLKSAAQTGQIFVGSDTHRLIGSSFECVMLEPMKMKGKSELVQVYRVLGVKTERARLRGLQTRGVGSELVGRDEELRTVNTSVEKLFNGEGGIVSVIGEAGLGKSRLIAEVRKIEKAQVKEKPTLWLEGRTFSFGETISYWTFQDLLKSYAGIDEDDGDAESWQKLERKVAEVFKAEEMLDVLPYLASMMSLEVRGQYVEQVKYLDGEGMGKQIFSAARKFFERLSNIQPTIVVFEDLHWVDVSSALLIQHLIPLVETSALLIVLISRPDPNEAGMGIFESALRHHARSYEQVRLRQLSAAQSYQLLRNLIDVEGLAQRVRELIVNKAEGNPFFMEEVIRSLIDSGTVARDEASGRWIATSHIESLTIPDTIQGVVMTRIDRLDDRVKDVLRTAAVIGRSFLYRVLREVVAAETVTHDSIRTSGVFQSPDALIHQHLDQLREIDLIREKRRTPELEYAFNHALAHDATYQSILLQKRREIHARVGETIEDLFADRLDEFYGVLAYHYARGEVWVKAQEYLLKAGDQAGQMASDAEALMFYQQALSAYGEKFESLQRATLERKMGEAFLRRGDHQQGLEYFQRALAHLGDPLPNTTVGMSWVLGLEFAQQVVNRLIPKWLRDLATLNESTPRMQELSRLYENVAWMVAFSDQKKFLLMALKQLNTSERSRYHYGVALGAASVGSVCDFAGWFKMAEQYHLQAVKIAERLSNPLAIASVYFQRCNHHFFQCRWDETMRDAERALDAYERLGHLRGQGLTLYVMGMTNHYQGEFLKMMAVGRRLINLGVTEDDSQVWCWGLFVEAVARARLGVLEEAMLQFDQAIEVAESVPDSFTLSLAKSEQAHCYSRQGELKQALEQSAGLQKLVDEGILISSAFASVRNNFAEACVMALEFDTLTDLSLRKKAAYRACENALKRGGAFRGGMPEALRWRGTYEWLVGNQEKARVWWERSLQLSEEYKMPYEKALTLFEIGKRLKDIERLRTAKWMFEGLDAEGDFERVKVEMGS